MVWQLLQSICHWCFEAFLMLLGAIVSFVFDPDGNEEDRSASINKRQPIPSIAAHHQRVIPNNTRGTLLKNADKVRKSFLAKQRKHQKIDEMKLKKEQPSPAKPKIVKRTIKPKHFKRTIKKKHLHKRESLKRMEAKYLREREPFLRTEAKKRKENERKEKERMARIEAMKEEEIAQKLKERLILEKQVNQWSEGKTDVEMVMALKDNLPDTAYFSHWETPKTGLSSKKILQKFQLFAHPDKWSTHNLDPMEKELMKLLWHAVCPTPANV